MKAFNEFHPAQAGQTGLILLLTEKLAEAISARTIQHCRVESASTDEHRQIDILTSGLTSLPPSHAAHAIMIRSSGLWEFVTRYSGATVPDFHGVP